MSLLLNGREVPLDATGAATLLDVIRDRGLTGAKEGCAEGECGACAVACVVRDEQGRTEYRVVTSCLVPAPAAAGHEIYTVEALAQDGRLTDAQRAMAAAGGSQCGYCTPGFVMSLFAEQYRAGREGPCDPHALSGNLCRCTGYRPIRDAARSVGAPASDRWLDRLSRPAPVITPTTLPGFSRPGSIPECIDLLVDDPEATLVAGATDLGVEANLRRRRFTHLIGLEAIEELRAFHESADHVSIGAGLPLSDLGRLWDDAPPAVGEWLRLFASPLVRNRATLGGNLATASPIGDAAPLLLALDARVTVAGPAGRRTLPLANFFTSYRRTILGRTEVLVAIDVPRPLPQEVRFYKVAKRRSDDISTVAAAMSMTRDAEGRVQRARVALGGVAATPVLVNAAADAMVGGRFDDAAVTRVQSALERGLRPMSDHRGSAAYRLAVAKRLVEKFQWECRS